MRSKHLPQLILTLGSIDARSPITVVMPIFNQRPIVVRVLRHLARCMSTPWALIIIDDASHDGTSIVVLEAIGRIFNTYSKLQWVQVYQNPVPLYETRCDAFGIRNSQSPFVLEVQADMFLYEQGFDVKMMTAASTHEDLMLISGRGTHSFAETFDFYMNMPGSDIARGSSLFRHLYNVSIDHMQKSNIQESRTVKTWKPDYLSNAQLASIFPDSATFARKKQAGMLGLLVEKRLSAEVLHQRKIWVGETVMRGPLLIRRSHYDSVGGLNTEAFFQGFDDHDVALRGWVRGFRSAYLPVGFTSPLNFGSTRKPRSIREEWSLATNLMRISRARKRSALGSMKGKLTPSHVIEVRDF